MLASVAALAAPIDPGSPTTDWTAVSYPTLIPDYSDDQQTGLGESDIVGDLTHPALYIGFDDAGTPSATDGNLGFRVRLGADRPPSGFSHFFGIGLDADLDGALDLFLAVDNSGNPDQLGIFDPGTGANTSPDTTSIVSTPLVSYSEMTSNYDFSAVDGTIDPLATTFDFDSDGENDYFLSFAIPFQDIVDELAAKTVSIVFTEDSEFRLVAGTSTQPNALNNDLGGPDGGTNSVETWEDLGAMSTTFAPADLLPTPEPDTGTLFGLGLIGLAAAKRRRRS
jgi:MYXO-CTERM domain-containing protein